MPTATPTASVTGGIAGQVRANSVGVANANLWLVSCPIDDVCDPESDGPIAQTRSDAGGFYSFANAPTAPDNRFYQVFYLNDESGGNTADDTRIYRWYGPAIEQYTVGTSADGGAIEIGELALLTPDDGQGSYPQQFTWRKRSGLTENYAWTLYDPQSGDEICRGPVAAATEFTLTQAFATANCGSAGLGGEYDWYVWAVAGSDLDQDPAGDSYFTGVISLPPANPGSQNIYLPLVAN
jgi:hypothetical protein